MPVGALPVVANLQVLGQGLALRQYEASRDLLDMPCDVYRQVLVFLGEPWGLRRIPLVAVVADLHRKVGRVLRRIRRPHECR